MAALASSHPTTSVSAVTAITASMAAGHSVDPLPSPSRLHSSRKSTTES